MENIRNRCTKDFIKKYEIDNIIKQQSELTFNAVHESYENCDSYTFKQNEVLLDEPIYLGFATLELSKLYTYETCYDKLQPYFGEDKLHLQNMDCDSSVMSMKTRNVNKDLKNLQDVFDFSNLNKQHD